METTTLAPNLGGERNLLDGIRRALRDADEAVLCVAFASMAGVNLLAPVIEPIRHREGALLLATTTFGTSTPLALARARELGVDVRVMNPSGGTFHPKLYVARRADRVSVVVGSANLTRGLVCNVEVATLMTGDMREPELAMALQWGRDLWDSPLAEPWAEPSVVDAADADLLTPELFGLVEVAVGKNSTVSTLGPRPKPNRIVAATRDGVLVETESSKAKGLQPQQVPAWMIQLAWDYLRTHGALTNQYLLAADGLNVKRSSFVCALLARLPGVVATTAPMGVLLAS